jgi:membrane protein
MKGPFNSTGAPLATRADDLIMHVLTGWPGTCCRGDNRREDTVSTETIFVGIASRWMTVKTFTKSLYAEFRNHGVDDSAASLGYYFVFSVFPFLFFLATLTAYLPFVQASVGRLLGSARAIMPPEAMALIDQHVNGLVHKPRPRLLGLGLAITLYSASRGVDGVRKALNLAYDVKETRPLWHTEALNFGMTIGGAFILLLGVAALVAGGDAGFWIARHLDVGAPYLFALKWARWPVTAMLMMSASALGYYVLPDVEQEFRFLNPGAVAGTLLSLAATWAFSAYAAHFGSYNVTYGTIGGVIILMTWFYITGFIYLMGGEANAILEHRSRRLQTDVFDRSF